MIPSRFRFSKCDLFKRKLTAHNRAVNWRRHKSWLERIVALGAIYCLAACKPSGPPSVPKPPAPEELARNLTRTQTAAVARKGTLYQLFQTREGARTVVEMARMGALPADLRAAAALELGQAHWPDLRQLGTNCLPPFITKDGVALPRLPDLVARSGNPANGQQIFQRPELNCIGCHKVQGQGVLLGSDLSDIGNRMDRESLFENILDPSAIITSGYETWQAITKSEDEYYGLLAEQTEAEVFIKDAKNNAIRLKKSDLNRLQQIPVSIMPLGLQASLTTDELADLVEYLVSLKKPAEGQ